MCVCVCVQVYPLRQYTTHLTHLRSRMDKCGETGLPSFLFLSKNSRLSTPAAVVAVARLHLNTTHTILTSVIRYTKNLDKINLHHWHDCLSHCMSCLSTPYAGSDKINIMIHIYQPCVCVKVDSLSDTKTRHKNERPNGSHCDYVIYSNYRLPHHVSR